MTGGSKVSHVVWENGLSAFRRVLFVGVVPEVLPAFSFGIVGASRCYRRALHKSGQVPFT